MSTSPKHRILVMSHAHPDFSLGGGEIAAYNIYKAYKANPEVEHTWFLGRADKGTGPTGAISRRREDEYLWEQSVYDWHMMKAVHQDSVVTYFADLIRAIKPTIIHTHHYAHLGLEYLRVIKQVDPNIKVIMTLHEYMAICRNNGQMIKTGAFKLCSRSSFDECATCFKDKNAEDFWLRKHYFMSHFDFVDQFVSPSEFLRQRYIEWGMAPDRIVVIENGQSSEGTLPPRNIEEGETRNVFGFFGQINPYKGIDVILQALADLPKKERKKIIVEIHGANLEWQTKEYKEKINRLCEPLINEGVVRWVGPYQPDELRERMSGVDWVLVPSIWWENSPMVIQEAFVCGRPLIVSNIGGMAEKVANEINGLHVSVGNSLSWGDTLKRATKDQSLWEKLRKGITAPITFVDCAHQHLSLLN